MASSVVGIAEQADLDVHSGEGSATGVGAAAPGLAGSVGLAAVFEEPEVVGDSGGSVAEESAGDLAAASVSTAAGRGDPLAEAAALPTLVESDAASGGEGGKGVAFTQSVAAGAAEGAPPVEDEGDWIGAVGWLSVTTKDGKALIRLVARPSPPSVEESGLVPTEIIRVTEHAVLDSSVRYTRIKRAWYGRRDSEWKIAPGVGLDVTGKVRQQLREGRTVRATNDLFTDPAPMILKRLCVEVYLQEQSSAGGLPEGPAPLSPPLPEKPPARSAAEILSSAEVAPNGTVTLSIDAWRLLRKERAQREKQLKALQSQVDSAQEELEELAQVKAELREQRALALEHRRRGNELLETSRMAAEELWALRAEEVAAEAEERERATAAEAEELAVGRASPPQEVQAAAAEVSSATAIAASAAAGSDGGLAAGLPAVAAAQGGSAVAAVGAAAGGEGRPVAAPSSVEWQRLLSERETTALELSRALARADELEAELEDRRVEVQVAERRRQRERNSLEQALRELRRKRKGSRSSGEGVEDDDVGEESDEGSEEGTESPVPTADIAAVAGAASADSAARQGGASFVPASPGLQPKPEKERKYLQKIAELEDQVEKLMRQLEEVQAREAALNESAVTRGAALRHATATARQARSVAAMPFFGEVGEALRGPSEPADGRTGRADLDGLAEMLDRLYVENFALRGKVGCQVPGVLPAAAVARPLVAAPRAGGPTSLAPAQAFDLSRFARVSGTDSDSDSSSDALARPGSRPATADRATGAAAPAALPRPAAVAAAACAPAVRPLDGASGLRSLGSPRSRLLQGLDFRSLSVVE